MQAAPLSREGAVTLQTIEYLTGTGQIRLTFSRPVVAGSVSGSSYRVTGANAAVRQVQAGLFSAGTVVTRASTGVLTPTAPAVSSYTGPQTPFVDTDGNRVPVWTGRPVTIV